MEAAKKIIEIASKYGGSVYGDYVAEVILPTLKGDKINESISKLLICSNGKPFGDMIAEIKNNFFVQKREKMCSGVCKTYKIITKKNNFSLYVFESRPESKTSPHRVDLFDVMFKIVDNKYIRMDDDEKSLYYLLNNIVTVSNIKDIKRFFSCINSNYLNQGWIVRIKNDRDCGYCFNNPLEKVEIFYRNGYWYYIPDYLKGTKIAALIILNNIEIKAIEYEKSLIETNYNKSDNLNNIEIKADILNDIEIKATDNLNNIEIKATDNLNNIKIKDSDNLNNIKIKDSDNLNSNMLAIFEEGLKVMSDKLEAYNDEELNNIYQIGVNEYRDRFNRMLNVNTNK